MDSRLHAAYERLLAHYGPQRWWPAQSPFEVLVGAVLVQNTAWRNVERAIGNLRDADLLEPRALYAVPAEELAEMIRPAGYYRVKATRLRNLLRLVVDEFDGDLEAMFATPLESLREQLLAVRGVGRETADAILLYAGQLPSFVVDTYTLRVLARHGWADFDTSYDELQQQFHATLERDSQLFNEYHALLVAVGKQHCRKVPICLGCPLAPLLPDGGPFEPC